MTQQLDPGPGGGAYASNTWTVQVDGQANYCYGISKDTHEDVEDFWTFSRPVGSGPWQLSAIQNV